MDPHAAGRLDGGGGRTEAQGGIGGTGGCPKGHPGAQVKRGEAFLAAAKVSPGMGLSIGSLEARA